VRALIGFCPSSGALHDLRHRAHDEVIRELADRVVVLLAGRSFADGAPADILSDTRVIENIGSVDA